MQISNFTFQAENACFCARVVEIGGKLFIHDLKHTLVVKYDDLEEMAYMKTDLTSPFPRIQGRALQWSSSMGPHLYKVISFMRIPGCLLFIGCVVFLRHTTQSIGVDFSQMHYLLGCCHLRLLPKKTYPVIGVTVSICFSSPL